MRALIQRVSAAAVEIVDEDPSSIGDGLVIFVGIGKYDSLEDVEYLVEKILNLRIFPSEDKDFEKSAIDIQAELLVISQFTLFANTRRGRRPSFSLAATPDDAKEIFHAVLEAFQKSGLRIETGKFQSKMEVEIHNSGPFTLMLDTDDRYLPRKGK